MFCSFCTTFGSLPFGYPPCMKLGPHRRLLLGGQGNTFGLFDITHTAPWAAVCHVLTAGGLDGEQKGMAVAQGNRSKTTRPHCRLLLIFSSARRCGARSRTDVPLGRGSNPSCCRSSDSSWSPPDTLTRRHCRRPG